MFGDYFEDYFVMVVIGFDLYCVVIVGNVDWWIGYCCVLMCIMVWIFVV